MAENPYVNKVIYGDQTLIDLTDDTVSPSSLKLGSTAHDASGAQITGTADDAPKRTLAYIFDSSDSYAVSDYVYYEDKLYRCIVAHSGTWNSEHFVETTIGDELNDKMAEMTILSYGKSTWNDFLTAYTGNKVVYCRASSNANPATGSQTRLAFMAYVNNATNPTNVEFQYYRSVSSHTASQQGDQVYVYKLDKTAGWTVTTREASVKIVAGTNMSSSYSNGTLTLNATDTTYESKAAASGGTDLSLVTTGEKYNWNARGIPSGGTSGQVLKKSSATDYATEWADESGSESLLVTFTQVNSSASYTADKTFAEVYAAYQNGTPILARVTYENAIYTLKTVTSTAIFLGYMQVTNGGGGVQESIITFNSNESASKNLKNAVIPTVPRVLNANPIINVYLDNTENPPRYYVSESDIQDATEITTSYDGKILVTLNYVKDSFTGATGDGPEESFEQYHLSDVHSVTTYDENEGTYSMKFHFVFTNEEVSSSGSKIKKFELVDDAFTYDNLLNATVTYSEEEIGGGGLFIVEFTGSNSSRSYQTPNKTFDEAYAAYQNGQTLIGVKGSEVYQLRSIDSSAITFDVIMPTDSSIRECASIRRILWQKSETRGGILYITNIYPAKALVIQLACNDDYAYKDNPSGTFSVNIDPGQLEDAVRAYLGRDPLYSDLFLTYGPEYDDWSSPERAERYEPVFAEWSEDYDDYGDPMQNVSITFRTLSMRGNTVVMKTVVVSGDAYSAAYGRDQPVTATYSETSLGTPPSASGVSF